MNDQTITHQLSPNLEKLIETIITALNSKPVKSDWREIWRREGEITEERDKLAGIIIMDIVYCGPQSVGVGRVRWGINHFSYPVILDKMAWIGTYAEVIDAGRNLWELSYFDWIGKAKIIDAAEQKERNRHMGLDG